MRKKVLVLGGNFGGLTAALSVNHELEGDVDVTVVSASDRFLFNPSLIWLPFGKRRPQDITFPLAPTFESHDVAFVHAAATRIDPAAQQVETTHGNYRYDYLVIATGYRNKLDVVPGLAENAVTITTLEDAIRAGAAWRRFLQDPGDVVVAATQGAGCFGAAYEFLFNLSYQLRRAGLKRRGKAELRDGRALPRPFRDRWPATRRGAAQHVHAEGAHPGTARRVTRSCRGGRDRVGRRHEDSVLLRHGHPAVPGAGGDPPRLDDLG
jgi:hypothetical protein